MRKVKWMQNTIDLEILSSLFSHFRLSLLENIAPMPSASRCETIYAIDLSSTGSKFSVPYFSSIHNVFISWVKKGSTKVSSTIIRTSEEGFLVS